MRVQRSRWTPQRTALTLTELVVVVICVGLLAGIVAPSLQEAIGKSRHTACLARLQRIGEATRTYSEYDPTGAALPVHGRQTRQEPYGFEFVGAYDWGGKSGIGRNNWLPQYTNTVYGSRYGTAAGYGPATRPLNNILYPAGFADVGNIPDRTFSSADRTAAQVDTTLELDAFRCPGDDGPPLGAHCPDWVDNPRRTSFDHFGTSYAANLFMIGFKTEMSSNSPYLRPLSDVPNPARTLAYEDNIGRWAWAARREIADCNPWISRGVDPGPTKSLRGWHGKDWTYNRAFVDAHAERQTIYIEGTEDADGYAMHYRNERLPCIPVNDCRAPGADPGPCESEADGFGPYLCVIVRGDGWQKDTLPAEPICTHTFNYCDGRRSYECCVEPARYPRATAITSEWVAR